jgi:Ca2+-binding RTX toxin-like protein
MTVRDVSGSEFIEDVASDVGTLPLNSYLTLGSLASESWNSVSTDDAKQTQNLTWKSSQGSSVGIRFTNTGNDSNGTYKGSSLFSSKYSGITASNVWSYAWSDNGNNSDSTNVSLTYTGDSTTKLDDIKYKSIVTEKTSSSGTWSQSKTLDFSNVDYVFQLGSSNSGTATTSGTSATFSLNLSKYFFKDISDGTSFNFNGKVTGTQSKDEVNLSLTNIKYVVSDYSITTAVYSDILTYAEWDALPDINGDGESSDLGSVTNNLSSLSGLFIFTDNIISVTSKTGVAIDAGAGNDKITGGIGDDTLIAGAGKDSLTGGKGNDTFKISKSDFDFTSAKTVLADTIADFKYTASEKDSLTLDGFGDVDVYKSLALAKKAGSTANVIYESGTGKFWYNEDGDSALVGAVLFANAKGISDTYWIAAGVM